MGGAQYSNLFNKNKKKLKTELSPIYYNDEFRNCTGDVALFLVFVMNNLQDIYSESVVLLKI